MTYLNGTMMQFFHWYSPSDGNHWIEAKNRAAELVNAGFTSIWLPPAFKGSAGGYDVGYGAYDLYDLGEFNQKSSIRTKYGTRSQYLETIEVLQAAKLQVYADVILDRKHGAEGTERIWATPFNRDDRFQAVGDYQEIEAYTHFYFPGRQGTHSAMEWHWWHFDAVNYNRLKPTEQNLIYLLQGKSFDHFISLEQGDAPFLLGCDLDFENAEVRQELVNWGKWYLDTTGVNGFRIDAAKHLPSWFLGQWLDTLRTYSEQELFAVGEFWSENVISLHAFIAATAGSLALFDVPLHYNFHRASQMGSAYDLRSILEGTLVQQQPVLAVTFVEDHNTQPLQRLASPVESWFKPIAYAIILLRQSGYPCVFYGDYYGAHYWDRGCDIFMTSHQEILDKLLYARQRYAYGSQTDYFDDPNLIGWTRMGDAENPQAMAVLVSNDKGGSKWMDVGRSSTKFVDLTGQNHAPVLTNEAGWGEFWCDGGSVSVWVQEG
ncbi:MAG TPA: alpha-amylase [Allocoleopsis sp.]